MGQKCGGMEVCLLTETFPPEVNGVSFTLARLARGLSSLGANVKVFEKNPLLYAPPNNAFLRADAGEMAIMSSTQVNKVYALIKLDKFKGYFKNNELKELQNLCSNI